MVSVKRYGDGTCMWCTQNEVEGVEAEFRQGLAGFFCKRCFRSAVKLRNPKSKEKTAGTAVPQPEN